MNDLTALLDRMRTQRPVAWDQLPDFALYMDQVLSYMDRQVLRFDEEDALTASMVNNYTKSGLVPRAEGKKYNREHLAYLTAICVLKAGDVHPGHGSADPGGTAGRAHRGGRIHRLLRKPEQRPAGHGPGDGGPSGRQTRWPTPPFTSLSSAMPPVLPAAAMSPCCGRSGRRTGPSEQKRKGARLIYAGLCHHHRQLLRPVRRSGPRAGA